MCRSFTCFRFSEKRWERRILRFLTETPLRASEVVSERPTIFGKLRARSLYFSYGSAGFLHTAEARSPPENEHSMILLLGFVQSHLGYSTSSLF